MTDFHSIQARRLIRAVGGVVPAGELCDISAGMMSNYQNENVRAFMTAHTIEVLQREAGSPVYSAALTNLVRPVPSKSLLCDAMDAARLAGALPIQIHHALADGHLDQCERRALMSVADELDALSKAIAASLSGAKQ
jgi:hypothetical protein